MKIISRCTICNKPTTNKKYCSWNCRTHKASKIEIIETLNISTIRASAERLDITVPTLYKLIKEYGIRKTKNRYVG